VYVEESDLDRAREVLKDAEEVTDEELTKLSEATQLTQPKKGKPLEIPVPTREAFDRFVRKVVGRPEGHTLPDGKDRPPEQSD
jgi:hypothetical protein